VKRTLGRSGIEVSAVGMGCWAIGGPWTMMGAQAGWGVVDDAESTRAIHAALELGANFFDTAANYGAGHSERVLGAALKGRRDGAVIATKFGYELDESARAVNPYGATEEASDVAGHVRENLEGSLRRLGTDHVDVYLLHVWGSRWTGPWPSAKSSRASWPRARSGPTAGARIGRTRSRPSRPVPVAGWSSRSSTS